MASAKDRFYHLLSLACEGPGKRRALLEETAALLLDWPSDYSEAMRAPVLILFEKTVRETDFETRAGLASRLIGHGDWPLSLINEFFLAAPGSLRRDILERNEAAGEDGEVRAPCDPAALIEVARDETSREFAHRAGRQFRIATGTAGAILADGSAEALAVLCKGTHAGRAAFSTLAILRFPGGDVEERLSIYDDIPQHGAERLAHHWQAHYPAETLRHAAE